jgi:methylated-DNA-protein-cysteine methyltransferase-like protein
VSKLARLRDVIAAIPRGKVLTYGQVAAAGGSPRAARLTVWTLNTFDGLPWHRVVAAGGRIALEGEPGREQRLRLELEGVTFVRGRVRMERHGWSPPVRTSRGKPRTTGGVKAGRSMGRRMRVAPGGRRSPR